MLNPTEKILVDDDDVIIIDDDSSHSEQDDNTVSCSVVESSTATTKGYPLCFSLEESSAREDSSLNFSVEEPTASECSPLSSLVEEISSVDDSPLSCSSGGESDSEAVVAKPVQLNDPPDKTMFQCQYCSKSFTKQFGLNRHSVVHHRDPLLCDLCGKQFASKSKLRLHSKSHDKGKLREKPHKCNTCFKRFAEWETFSEHMKEHIAEKGRKYSRLAQEALMISLADEHRKETIRKKTCSSSPVCKSKKEQPYTDHHEMCELCQGEETLENNC